MKLDAVKFGLACGLVWAGAVLCLGLMGDYLHWGIGMVKGLGSLYLGYKPTLGGAVVGMVWAFFDGGSGGWAVATLYNWLLARGK